MKRSRIAALAMALTLALGTLAHARDVNVRNYDYNEDPSSGAMFFDAVLVRPVTLGVAVIGAVAWVVTLPVSIPAGDTETAAEEWVTGPLKYTFLRPLGDLDSNAEPDYSDYEQY